MNNLWAGASGAGYEYAVHELPSRPPNYIGNYIFAKVVNDVWHAVYIGQGNLQDRHDAAIKEGCVTQKGATHYHEHLNYDEIARKGEESDLIAGNPECEWPQGCNGHD